MSIKKSKNKKVEILKITLANHKKFNNKDSFANISVVEVNIGTIARRIITENVADNCAKAKKLTVNFWSFLLSLSLSLDFDFVTLM